MLRAVPVRFVTRAVAFVLPFILLSGAATGQNVRREPMASPQPSPPAPASQAAGPPHELTASDLEAFLDGIVPRQIDRDNIAGAVVAVVAGDRVIFEKGYGYADLEKRTLVSPQTTLFRPGSISKLFTWTAVMQLVEQRKLDLDRDINQYLDFPIPATFPEPITLRHVMTHTAGFEEVIKDLFVGTPEQLRPLREYLVSHLPRRIFAPGTTPAYSNYATALAGFIVERTSGQPYFDYVTDHILMPLGMTHSTPVQPLPAFLEPSMSKGYRLATSPPKAFEYVQAWPAGSMSVSADDITRFMLAHLHGGAFQGARILQPDTVRSMHTAQRPPAPGLNAMALGFYEESRNGHRIIGHGGDTQYFHSDLHLMPDAGIGFFVSYNSAGRGQANNRAELWHAVLDRYFPVQRAQPTVVTSAKTDASSVAGTYLVSRRSDDSVLRLAGVSGELTVSGHPDGVIQVSALTSGNGQPKKWQEVGPLLYREVDGQDRIAFRRNPSGQLELVTDFPIFVFQRIGWIQNRVMVLVVFAVSVLVLLLTLVAWPIAAGIRRHYGRPLTLTLADRRVRVATRLVCAFELAVVCVLVWVFVAVSSDFTLLTSGYDNRLRAIGALGLIAVLATVIPLFNAYRAWRDVGRWRWSRPWDTLVALACVALVWVVASMNFVGFSTRY